MMPLGLLTTLRDAVSFAESCGKGKTTHVYVSTLGEHICTAMPFFAMNAQSKLTNRSQHPSDAQRRVLADGWLAYTDTRTGLSRSEASLRATEALTAKL